MATLEQLQNALIAADKAGATDDARRLAQAIIAIRQSSTPQQQAAAAPADAAPSRSLADHMGLAARAGVKGVLGFPGMGADAIGGVMNGALALAGADYRFKPTRQTLDDTMTAAGLPSPATPGERVAGAGMEMMTGAGAASKLAGLASEAVVGPVARAVLGRLSADPTSQMVTAAGSGVAGQQAKEVGAGPVGEFASAIGGGLLGAGGLAAARGAGSAISGAMPKYQQINIQAVDQRINISLQASGIDPATINPAMRQALREQVGAAMKLGDLDQGAVSRLADYTRLGLTPTRGRLTLDPFDVTREQNAAKQAAALGMTDNPLVTVSNKNNAALLGKVDDFNPVADRFTTGQAAMAPIQARDAAMEATKRQAYKAAEDMAGGDIPLMRAPVMDEVYKRLNKGNLVRHVPANVQAMLDDIAAGTVKAGGKDFSVPFDVSTVDSLKSLIATEMRSSKGSAKMALSAIRGALDDVPLQPQKATFGGGQVVTEAGGKFLRDQDAQAGLLKGALDDARGKNFQWMRWRESAPGIEAAVNDANPETFVRNFIRSQGADARDVAKAAQVINTSAPAREAVRSEIVQYLKDAAIGKGNISASGNFSGPGWKSALDSINDRKLALFFDADEVAQLKSIGRVGGFDTFQPRGSAVNNSNTAAGVAGLLQGITKFAKPLANKLPLGESVITRPLENVSLSLLGRGAKNIPSALLTKRLEQQSLLDPLLIPGFMAGGLLAAP